MAVPAPRALVASAQRMSHVQHQRTRRRHPGLGRQLEHRPQPFVWHHTAEQILERLAGDCTALNQNATK
jgi:hypothetical protein